jgi:hypothetical protein
MPRFHPQLTTTVFYLYGRNQKGELDGPWGTGVFVLKKARVQGEPNHVYAVTAYHVAVTSGASSIRINALDGAQSLKPEFIEKDPAEWHFLPGGDDIAAIDVTDEFDGPHSWIRGVPETDFVTPAFIEDASISLGEDGFMLGLFTGQPGEKFNLPAARFGNLSLLANFPHPIEQGHGIARPSHIFDMHSRPGFSGSPVFVYRTPFTDLSDITEDGILQMNPNQPHLAFVKLLGIHSGQFVERIEARKTEVGVPIVEGDKLRLQSSMTIIVPAWSIGELLDSPALKEQREMRERK